DEPAPERRRHPGLRRGRSRGRRAGRRRQHVRLALPPAAARAGGGRRDPLDHEVPRRALRPDRRLRRDERSDGRRAPDVPPEVARRGARPVRLLAPAARDQDARRAHAEALRERARDRRLPRAPPERRARSLSGSPVASGPPHRGAADARLRGDGLAAARVRGGGGGALQGDEDLPARGEPRRRGEPDRAPGGDDSRVHGRRAVRRSAEPRPLVGRDRVGRGPRRGPRGGARPLCRNRRRLKPEQDAYGRLVLEYLETGEGTEIVERDDGFIATSRYGPAVYFAPLRRWVKAERQAMRLLRGRVLDVGCGAGRGAAPLQERGHEVVAIDLSPLAVEVSRRRGVRDTRELPVTRVGHELGRFDTIVMFGNNFGLMGSRRRAPWLLRRFGSIANDGA